MNKMTPSLVTAAAVTMLASLFVTGCGNREIEGDKAQQWRIVEKPDDSHDFALVRDGESYPFDLLDPELAPAPSRTLVMLGFNIIEHTQQYAGRYAGDSLTCSNCHFNAGNNLGGPNNGISLVGVPSHYPRFSERENRSISLRDRINSCFERSLNGHPLPKEGHLMNGIVAYLEWISSDVDKIEDIPWLGLRPLKALEKYRGDVVQGQNVYVEHCTACHRPDGGGTEGIPALFGPHSFNDGAGMNKLNTLAPFVHANMPQDKPVLTPEQAIDVATYIISMPRPHYEEQKNGP